MCSFILFFFFNIVLISEKFYFLFLNLVIFVFFFEVYLDVDGKIVVLRSISIFF